jgi:hypothetical protein
VGAGYTEVKIYNMVFDLLEEETAVTIADARAPVKWLNRNFQIEVDALLRRVPWNFARERAALTKDATNPAFEWLYRYAIPATALRILPVTYFSRTGITPYSLQIEGDFILSNLSSPANFIYIKRITDATKFDALFAQALATRLALKMAHWMTGRQSYVEGMKDLYSTQIQEAVEINEVESNYQVPYDDELLLVRQ